MNHHFLQYDEALALKQLGFNELCFAYYHDNQSLNFVTSSTDARSIPAYYQNDSTLWMPLFSDKEIRDKCCTAPLYPQAFEWFRKNYGLEGVVQRANDYTWYKWTIYKYEEENKIYNSDYYEYKSFESAQLHCLKRLIKIITP